MAVLHSVLVDIDPEVPDHPALEHAVALAARHGARVKVVDVLPFVPESARGFVTEALEAELVEHRRERLTAIAEGDMGVPVTTELLRGRPGTALIQEVVRAPHDLVVRSHGRDRGDSSRPFGAIDMELLRQCPCPVWLVDRRASRRVPRRILAAVHANPDEPTEQALNTKILDWAFMLKEGGDDELTVLQAWTPYGASLLRPRMSPDEFAEFIEAARSSEDKALTACLERSGHALTGVPVQLVQGEPADAITNYVESRNVDVVVMGTVARTGIAGLVMGNTAERVLRRLRGSVLAVKPPGFQPPATPHARQG
jgi:nucleotide-binding universal stress UspA family protein